MNEKYSNEHILPAWYIKKVICKNNTYMFVKFDSQLKFQFPNELNKCIKLTKEFKTGINPYNIKLCYDQPRYKEFENKEKFSTSKTDNEFKNKFDKFFLNGNWNKELNDLEFELFIESFIYYYETRIDKYGVISQQINDLKAQNLMDSVLVTIKDKRAYLSEWFNNNQKLLNKFKGWIKSSPLIGTNEWYNDLLDIENNKGGHISHITLVNNHGCAIPFGDGSNFILDDINIIKLIFPLIVNEKYGKIRLYFFRYSYDKFLIMSIIRFKDNNQYKKFNKDVLLLNNQLAADKLLTIYLGEMLKQSMHYILIPKNKNVSD